MLFLQYRIFKRNNEHVGRRWWLRHDGNADAEGLAKQKQNEILNINNVSQNCDCETTQTLVGSCTAGLHIACTGTSTVGHLFDVPRTWYTNILYARHSRCAKHNIYQQSRAWYCIKRKRIRYIITSYLYIINTYFTRHTTDGFLHRTHFYQSGFTSFTIC